MLKLWMSKLRGHTSNLLKIDASEDVKVIYLYRYMSWAITSIVYLIGKPYSLLILKLGVVISLFVLSKVITDLYIRYRSNGKILKNLILVETIGITFLLLPTGGLKSPFIWFALNVTLVAACFLPIYFCWCNLIFYLLVGSTMTHLFFSEEGGILSLLTDKSEMILVFILITLAVQLLARLVTRLHKQKKEINIINKQLELSNNKKEESIEHIISIYKIIEAFNNHSNKEKLFKELAIHASTLTKSPVAFFWLPNLEEDESIVMSNKLLNKKELGEIFNTIEKLDCSVKSRTFEVCLFNNKFTLVPVNTNTSFYGYIGIQQVKATPLLTTEQNQNLLLLSFIAELSAVTLDRVNMDKIEDQILVVSEQNRIANEIHDSVSQRLFSISYAIHGLIARWNNLPIDEIKPCLEEIQDSSKMAMQELRDSIYHLSSIKKGEKSLQKTLTQFLDNIGKLNNVEIDIQLIGEESRLPITLKNSLTRIIREACGNAIRHGKSKAITIKLVIASDFLKLSIIDDGIGFDLVKGDNVHQRGLGLSNIGNLVDSFRGVLDIVSEIGSGTKINIIIPIKIESNNEGAEVAI